MAGHGSDEAARRGRFYGLGRKGLTGGACVWPALRAASAAWIASSKVIPPADGTGGADEGAAC